MSHQEMDFVRKGYLRYKFPPNLQKVKAEHTLAKKKMSKFFLDEMHQSGRFFYENPDETPLYGEEQDGGPGDTESTDFTVFEIDHQHKRKMAKPQLSIAKLACSMNNKKLFFGGPPELLAIEDIAYSIELEELKYIFD